MIFIQKNLYFFYFILIILIIFSYFEINKSYDILDYNSSSEISNYYFSNDSFFWPVPGYNKITSYFGKRISPTAGASSNHSGIDIGAPNGTNIFSISSGVVSLASFKGAGGCTITINSGNLQISYCHVSPNFLVKKGDVVNTGDLIGNVGPKNIFNIPGNPYKDSSGNPTNGATTGPHLHLTIKKDGIAVNPLDFF